MKAMLKLWVTLLVRFKAWAVLATFVATSFLAFGTANAAPMSNTLVSWEDFAENWAPEDIQNPLVTNFNIGGASGQIVSVAYRSNDGPTKGMWVYAYQIILFRSVALKRVDSFSAPAFIHGPATVGRTRNFSFRTDKPWYAKEFCEFWREWEWRKGHHPTSATYDYNARNRVYTLSWGGFSIDSSPMESSPMNDRQSAIFGYVSKGPPRQAPATLSITDLRIPPQTYTGHVSNVWVASPEPASALLLGIGLLGIGMFKRSKR